MAAAVVLLGVTFAAARGAPPVAPDAHDRTPSTSRTVGRAIAGGGDVSPDRPGAKVALLVGCNKYDKRGFRDLEFAERDVEELAPLLEKAGYEVQLLTSRASGTKRATLRNIQAAAARLLTNRTKRDVVLVALAGHGVQVEALGADGKLHADSYFCPCDAEQDKLSSLLAMGTLFDEIDRRGGGQNMLLVDACRDDPTRGRGLDGSRVQTIPKGLAILFSCSAGQKAFETRNAGGGHGVFFHFVLGGMRGGAANSRGEITWHRLVEFVTDRMDEQVAELVGDAAVRQTPNNVTNLEGRSPVLLVSSKRAAHTPDLVSKPPVTIAPNQTKPSPQDADRLVTSGSPADRVRIPRSAEPDDETCATAKLDWAKKQMEKQPRAAKTTLEDLVRLYPQTKASGEGKTLLNSTNWEAEAQRAAAAEAAEAKAAAERYEQQFGQPIIPIRIIRVRIR